MKLARARFAFSLSFVVVACRGEDERKVVEGGAAPPPPSAATPDRLPPGKLLEGPERAFSLPIPKRMRVEAKFPREVHAAGPVSADDLAEFVRDRVLVRHVEMIGEKIVFPIAQVRGREEKSKGAEPLLRIEIYAKKGETWLRVVDETPVPGPRGLSEAERWKRAGMTPTGELIDQQNLE